MSSKMKLYTAALLAVLIGFPLAEEARADPADWFVIDPLVNLAGVIASAVLGIC